MTKLTTWQATIQDDDTGAAIVSPVVTIRLGGPAGTLADLFDITGAPISNPVTGGLDGFVQFQVRPGRYWVQANDGGTFSNAWYIDVMPEEGLSWETRSEFVTDWAAGMNLPDGTVVSAGGVQYEIDSTATAISDLVGVKPFGHAYTPLHWGAVGDGATDDGSSFNLATAAYRTALNAQAGQRASLVFDGLGLTYRSTVPIDFTKLQTWGWQVRDFTILSEAAGLIAVEQTGSRGGRWENVVVYGDEFSEPSVGIYAARSSGVGGLGFCDNNYYSNVKTIGYYSVAGGYFYGQETTTYDHCAFWNYDHTGRAAIHTGDDTGVTSVTTTHETPVTGAVSYINDVYINCDWRYLPVDRTFSITGIALGASTVLTVSGDPSGLLGDDVTFFLVGGTDELNNLVGTVTAVTSSTITVDIDSTSFTAYTTGGTVYGTQVSATVLFGRGSDHTFQGCYMVAYGKPNLEVFFPDSSVIYKNKFDVLFEGSGSAEHIRFNTGGSAKTIGHTVVSTYNTHSRQYVITSPDALEWQGGEIVVTNNSRGNPTLFNSASNFTMYGVDITEGLDTAVSVASLAAWSGNYHRTDGTNHIVDSYVSAPTAIYPISDKTVDIGLPNRRVRDGYLEDVHLTDTLQYQQGDGVGGSVTQLIDKTTAVTINKRSGTITLAASSLAAGASATFEVNNSTVQAGDMPYVVVASASNAYTAAVKSTSAGRFSVVVTNTTGGALAQAFAVYFAMQVKVATT